MMTPHEKMSEVVKGIQAMPSILLICMTPKLIQKFTEHMVSINKWW